MIKKLTDVLGDADWDRFHSYAKRVRSLEFDETVAYRSDPDTPDLDSTIIAVLSLHHPFGSAFLPGLQQLSWRTEGSALPMLPFLSRELKQLDLHMSTQIPATANEVFKAIVHRTPSLVIFYLKANVQGTTVDMSLARWLQTTTNLEEVSFPAYYLTPALIRALGSLPRLKRIGQNSRSNHSSDSSRQLQCFPPGSFPHLLDIGFNATLFEAPKFLLGSLEVASRLVHLVLHASGTLDSENILKFVRHVAQNCHMLTELGLDLFSGPRYGEQSLYPLKMELLESLYPCIRLEALDITYPLLFTFQENDVEEMGRAWPQMVLLHVCPDPDFSLPFGGRMGSSLSILSAFAKALPKLESVRFYLKKQEAPPFTGNLYPPYQFQNLNRVHFGLSPVPDGRLRHVGFYIASLCKERPTISCGRSNWHTGNLPSDWAGTKSAWKEVNDMVGFAMEVKRAGLSSLRDNVAE
ncbi:hypothetical protein FS837_006872 [Tulasnella sp. UAMH 9824]|nr:hypothetical protein FS837_006872 [Tulasnella sp. UAMH 9824]